MHGQKQFDPVRFFQQLTAESKRAQTALKPDQLHVEGHNRYHIISETETHNIKINTVGPKLEPLVFMMYNLDKQCSYWIGNIDSIDS